MKECKGLTDEEVHDRIRQGLDNKHNAFHFKSEKEIIRDNTLTYFNFLNLFLFVLVLLTMKIRNGLFIGTVIFNTGIGIFQEIKARRLLAKMTILVESKISVLRNGEWTQVSSDNLVEDDIIRLQEGMQIPADCIILEGSLEVNESLLTGEGDTLVKKENDEVYCGTDVTGSLALVQVIHTGKRCAVSHITEEAEKVKRARSQLSESMDQMIHVISAVIIPFMILLFLEHTFILDMDWQASVLKMVAAVIGMIPEGLVVLTSIALAVSSIRLSEKSVLVQDLFSVETIARVDTVCLDKTGTLTKGTLSVVDVQYFSNSPEEVNRLIQRYLVSSCSTNATQQALIRYFGTGENEEALDMLPFTSERKYAAVAYEELSVYIGAPSFLFPDGNKELEELTCRDGRDELRNIVCAVSHKKSVSDGLLPNDLKPTALIRLKDDLRENVDSALRYLYSQSVDVRIISGDDPKTVSRIAEMAGVRNSDCYVDLSRTQEPVESLVQKYTIFGRVLPEQKKEIVDALKKNGHTIAMTGDGVNDVPALKSADMSIAMASGSSAARNCSNAVLLNDDFCVIPDMIHEGRRVINNISRASSMYLVKTIFSFLLSLTVLLTAQPYPFLPIQLTVISAFGVGIPTFLLQMEPSFEKVKDHFFERSFLKALPSAATIYLCALACLVMKHVTGISDYRFYGIFVSVTSFIYLFTLYEVYRPLTRRRTAVIAMMGVLYLLVYSLFGKHIYISFEKWDILTAGILILSVPFCIKGIKEIMNKIIRGKQYAGRK